MKKYILATLLLPILSFAQIENRPALKVTANYHNRSCVGGVGFCSESSSIEESKTFNATIQKKTANQLVFVIDVKQLSKVELNQIISEKTITVSGKKPLSLSKNLISKLNIDSKYSEIATGSYPVQIVDDKINITFSLFVK